MGIKNDMFYKNLDVEELKDEQIQKLYIELTKERKKRMDRMKDTFGK